VKFSAILVEVLVFDSWVYATRAGNSIAIKIDQNKLVMKKI
jgi:hypothetical protein